MSTYITLRQTVSMVDVDSKPELASLECVGKLRDCHFVNSNAFKWLRGGCSEIALMSIFRRIMVQLHK